MTFEFITILRYPHPRMNAQAVVFALMFALLLGAPAAHTCAIEGETLTGPVFPPDGSTGLPLNVRFMLFPDNDVPADEDIQALLYDGQGSLIAEVPASYEPDGKAVVVRPVGQLEASSSYSLEFPIPDTELFWRNPVTFTTGTVVADLSPPTVGPVTSTLEIGFDGCFDDGRCGPWGAGWGTILIRYALDSVDDDSGFVGLRVYAADQTDAASFQVPGGWPLGSGDITTEVLDVVRSTCCETSDPESPCPVTCTEEPTLGYRQVEAFDIAGNSWWSDDVAPYLRDFEGFAQLGPRYRAGRLFPGGCVMPGERQPTEPEPAAEPEPNPAAGDAGISDSGTESNNINCSSAYLHETAPPATLVAFLILASPALWRRRRSEVTRSNVIQ